LLAEDEEEDEDEDELEGEAGPLLFVVPPG
jgi:hypothetical protein